MQTQHKWSTKPPSANRTDVTIRQIPLFASFAGVHRKASCRNVSQPASPSHSLSRVRRTPAGSFRRSEEEVVVSSATPEIADDPVVDRASAPRDAAGPDCCPVPRTNADYRCSRTLEDSSFQLHRREIEDPTSVSRRLCCRDRRGRVPGHQICRSPGLSRRLGTWRCRSL